MAVRANADTHHILQLFFRRPSCAKCAGWPLLRKVRGLLRGTGRERPEHTNLHGIHALLAMLGEISLSGAIVEATLHSKISSSRIRQPSSTAA